MANTVSFKLSGLKEVQEALSTMGRRQAANFLKKAETKASKVFLDAIQDTVPHDTDYLSEHMVAQAKLKGDSLTMRIGPDKSAFWGLFTEMGTKNGIRPVHWLFRAFMQAKDAALEEFVKACQQMIAGMKK